MNGQSLSRLFVTLCPGEEQSLEPRFQPESDCFTVVENEQNHDVIELLNQEAAYYVLSHSHVVFLTKAGLVGRVAYKITEVSMASDGAAIVPGSEVQIGRSGVGAAAPVSQRVVQPGAEVAAATAAAVAAANSDNGSNPAGGAVVGGSANVAEPTGNNNNGVVANSSPSSSRGAKVRRVMLTRSRMGRSMLVSSRPMIPASSVPEELIAEAQVVLQGKPREVILRELQRTNCDVNQAVNNLLSREDDNEMDEGMDDNSDTLFPEELISLLDTGNGEHPSVIINADQLFADDLWSVTLRRRGNQQKPAVTNDAKQSDNAREPGRPVSSGKRMVMAFDGLIEMWPAAEGGVPVKFRDIGATYSEMLAVNVDGVLCSWRWDAAEPSGNAEHPKLAKLRLRGEFVERLACSSARTTVLTQSKMVASFVDPSLDVVSDLLDTPCCTLPEVPVDIYACPLYSCARVASGALYWWGVMPTKERMKVIENCKSKSKKQYAVGSREIVVGSTVRMRSSPIFLADAVGFTMVDGYPQIALLLDNVWTSNETVRFQVINSYRERELAPGVGEPERAEEDGSQQEQALPVRRKRAFVDRQSYVERKWCLQSVVIMEENRNIPMGKVMMVDGPYCAVCFGNTNNAKLSECQEDGKNWRLMHKDELVPALKPTVATTVPDYVIREPKKLELPIADGVIDLCVDSSCIWCLYKRHDEVMLCKVSLSGALEDERLVCRDAQCFKEGYDASKGRSMSKWLVNVDGEPFIYVLDGRCSLIPVWKSSTLRASDPSVFSRLTNLAAATVPSSMLSCGAENSTKSAVVTIFTYTVNQLLKAVLNYNLPLVKDYVTTAEQTDGADALRTSLFECRTGGGRNVLHTLVAMSIPPSNKDNVLDAEQQPFGSTDSYASSAAARTAFDKRWEQMITINDVLQTVTAPPGMPLPPGANYLPNFFAESTEPPPTLPAQTSQQQAQSPLIYRSAMTDPKDRQRAAYGILKFLCTHERLVPEIALLLQEKNSDGLTPFMYALECRLYRVAVLLWQTIHPMPTVTPASADAVLPAIYPKGSRPENCPLHVIACNDTCSFTWTGADHINQDIFECRTCGLVGSLCCCTECAYVCHKGHDCTLKKTSPTAYCDCWERCRCKSLIADNFDLRMELFRTLLQVPALHSVLNAKNEHILLFTLRTLIRQLPEQRQYHVIKRKGGEQRNFSARMPECDLEPQKFSQKALEVLLNRGDIVMGMISVGLTSVDRQRRLSEAQFYLLSQEGVTFLDRFMYYLLVRLPLDHCMEAFVKTVGEELKKHGQWQLSNVLFRRLARSAIRVFSAITICSQFSKSSRKTMFLNRCNSLFSLLLPYTVVELASAAHAVLTPIRFGTVKSTDAYFPFGSDLNIAVGKAFLGEPSCFPRQSLVINERLYRTNFPWDDGADVPPSSRAATSGASDHESDSDNETITAARRESAISTDWAPERSRTMITQATTPFSDETTDDSEDDPAHDGHGEEDGAIGAREITTAQPDDEEEDEEEEADSDNSSVLYDVKQEDSDQDAFFMSNFNDRRARSGRDTPIVHRTLPMIKTMPKKRTADPGEKRSSMPMPLILARLFHTYVLKLTNLLVLAADVNAGGTNHRLLCPLPITPEVGVEVQEEVERQLSFTWQWLYPLMDSLEATLRFSTSVCAAKKFSPEELRKKLGVPRSFGNAKSSSNKSAADAKKKQSSPSKDGQASSKNDNEEPDAREENQRNDAMAYVTSLLRLNSSEHGEDLPTCDLLSLKHVAIVVDALLHSMNTSMHLCNKLTGRMYYSFFNAEPSSVEHIEHRQRSDSVFSHEIAGDLAPVNGGNPFFTRSDSMIYPGLWPVNSSFTHAAIEQVPLSLRPHLLQPNACKEAMFGLHKVPVTWEEHWHSAGSTSSGKPVRTGLASTEADCLVPVAGVGKNIWSLRPSPSGHRLPVKSEQGAQEEDQDAKNARVTSVIVHSKELLEGAEPMDTCPAPSSSFADAAEMNTAEVQLYRTRELIQMLQSRWRFTLSAFAKNFQKDLSKDPMSFAFQLSGYSIKAYRFRKLAERFRNSVAKDLNLEVERDREQLLTHTFRQFNIFSERRSLATGCRQAMAVHRLKVSFKNEQGEGTGVTRSFYTAIAEAILSKDPLPDLQSAVTVLPVATSGRFPFRPLRSRYHHRDEGGVGRRPYSPSGHGWSLSVSARSFVPGNRSGVLATDVDGGDRTRQSFGDRLFSRVSALYPSYAQKLTGMLLELPAHHIILMLSNQHLLKANCDLAHNALLNFIEAEPSLHSSAASDTCSTSNLRCNSCPDLAAIPDNNGDTDRRPLFIQSARTGFYSPTAGCDTPTRLNAYRNVGRLIGLCLLHNEVMPLSVCRSVLKFILGRPINWYDMAFYDWHMYENFYMMARGEYKPEDLTLNFTITLDPLEGGMTIPLVENGADIPVTGDNVMEYIFYYTSFRLVNVCFRALESLRDGVYDVLPTYLLEGLTAEDLRLLLAGNVHFNVKAWQEITLFTDETSANVRKLMQPEKLAQFKRWFWSIVENMTADEKQELIHFWTGSAALPAAPDGASLMPNVVIRPPDDQYLPTANTCVSRLYIPLYSSKSIMRQKILTAIKVQTFGFV